MQEAVVGAISTLWAAWIIYRIETIHRDFADLRGRLRTVERKVKNLRE